MGMIINPFGSVSASVAKRYWRLRFPSGSPHANFLALEEIEFRATVGGSDLSSSGTAIASSSNGSETPGKAFDDNPLSDWSCASGAQVGSWIGCDLGSDQDLQEIVATGLYAGSADYGPSEIVVDYSPDGSAWTNDTRWPTMTGLLWDLGDNPSGTLGEIKKIRRTDTGLPVINIEPSPLYSQDNVGWANFTIRLVFPPAGTPGQGGTKVRIAFRSANAEGLNLSKCYIGKKTGTYGFVSAPTQVLFNGGSAGFTIAAASTQWSDDISFSFSSTDTLVISAFCPSGAGATDGFRQGVRANTTTWYKSGDDATTQAASGYTQLGGNQGILAGLEVE